MEIKIITTQRVLSPTQITLADYAINPYRGCEFGCVYCYTQENKNIKRNPSFLGVKLNAPHILEKELRYKTPKRVVLGSATECFQYKELKYRLTGKILKLLNSHNIPYTILTKSHLIIQYLSLIAKNKKNKIYFTINFSSNQLIKKFEKKTPSIEKRLQAIKAIRAHNIPLRLHIGPFIPYISTLEEIVAMTRGIVKEVNVEMYHHKMGNFKKIIKISQNFYSQNIIDKIIAVYASKNNYMEFAAKLKKKLSLFSCTTQQKFFFILPDFGDYYNARVDYEDNE